MIPPLRPAAAGLHPSSAEEGSCNCAGRFCKSAGGTSARQNAVAVS